ncbi:hypothetical protein [Hoeflea poritis]|uniref:Uncharacterized protein n=1 Tax=Hoeflea poritis TaxID=2993659 RepID=A0ABT4VPJ3_9HYPH|nr:hypothetical protein [Hoeflea poritis]MDA4846075.1 hypothetical protein [Hoeflea poritis]
MFNTYAERRMNAINTDIRSLVDRQDTLSDRQWNRLQRLDRAHHFWKRIADS